MAFWDIFTPDSGAQKTNFSQLHHRIKTILPDSEEKELIMVACLAGLLARVAYIDFEIHKDEVVSMKENITKWSKFNESIVNAIVEIAIEEIKELAGLENHLYCHPLNEILENDQKYSMIESLFAISASDGKVSEEESEEIRIITKGLHLEHKHFVSARATVLDLSKI